MEILILLLYWINSTMHAVSMEICVSLGTLSLSLIRRNFNQSFGDEDDSLKFWLRRRRAFLIRIKIFPAEIN